MASPYTVSQAIVKSLTFSLNQLFPSECLCCHKEGDWLCPSCKEVALQIISSTCPFCDRLSPLGKTCQRCRTKHALSGARSLWYYKGPVKNLVHTYKYGGILASTDWITLQLSPLLHELPVAKHHKVIITSVPSSKDRLAERGYNQSEVLAKALTKATGYTYKPLLVRTTKAPSQTSLTRQERIANMENQFRLIQSPLQADFVVIVDDVLTTGATLSSCALTLKQAGIKHIWGITIAKD